MQISNSLVGDSEASKCRIYSTVKTPLVDEHAFPPTGVRLWLVRLLFTFGGSDGILTTARPELPYTCSSQAKTRCDSSRKGKSVAWLVNSYKPDVPFVGHRQTV